MVINKKCKMQGKIVTACDTLSRSVGAHPFSKAKGVSEWNGTNIETGKLVRRIYGVKSGEYVKQGISFNFCPFCGKDLRKSLT